LAAEDFLMLPSEIEIRSIPPLDGRQTALIDSHSLLNTLNVLEAELRALGATLAEDPQLLGMALGRCEQIRRELGDPLATLGHAARAEEFADDIGRALRRVLDQHPETRERSEVVVAGEAIAALLAIFHVRARELLVRSKDPEAWVSHDVERLTQGLRDVFAVAGRRSRGRYRVTFDPAEQGPGVYYIDLAVDSVDPGRIRLPIVVVDVIRDLLANARKYTEPGGAIFASLIEEPERIYFSVQDTGCGIPTDEIEAVVHAGRRGSNVAQRRTMGGGFGLTKAFLVARRFGGRLWISSKVGVGTRVRFELPRRAAMAA
jgi:signal transduction histidine kinase